jgi:hypothetical protein
MSNTSTIPADKPIAADDKHFAEVADRDASSSEGIDVEEVDDGAQNGVRNAEIITKMWNKWMLAVVFGSIWLCYFVNAFQASITANLTPFVLSDFAAHSLVTSIYVVSNIVPGAFRLCLSRVLDLWGRAQGFFIMLVIACLGLILMATTKNVETYAAAQVS